MRTKAISAHVTPKKPLLAVIQNDIRKNIGLYLMFLPVFVYYVIFHYWPMYGVQLAFKNYKVKLGIAGSPWAGFDHFERFFTGYNFWDILGNTLRISVTTIVFTFPLTLCFALLLNYITTLKFKKTLQMVSYAPHFISMVVICGMLKIFLTPESGAINQLIGLFGIDDIAFLSKPELFLPVYVTSELWQTIGWGSIIYISALAGVDPSLHEAAIIDGATKIQRIIFIDIPCIAPTVMILFILRMGQVMNLGFEKIFLLQNSLNMSTSDVISTYIYRIGLINSDYEFATAVGLFNSIINITLLVTVNTISKKFSENSLW